MRTIASPLCSKIVVERNKDRVLWKEHSCNSLVRSEVGFFSSKNKHGLVGFLHLIRTNYKSFNPVLASSSPSPQSQAEVGTAETESQSIHQLKTVRIRFLLQKECAFGEQFLLVGDDPVLGSWNPENAVPLNWSDGHVWVVELDAPLEKSIQYKFVLRGITGKILWQPGSDRILQTWNTEKTIVVSEDWEDAALQKIVEEEPLADQNAESTGSSEMLIVAENSSHQKEELIPNSSKETTIDDENLYAAKNPSLDSAKKLSVRPEEQVAIIPDNISYPQEDPAVNRTGNAQDQKEINNSKDEPVATADKNLVAGKEIISGNGRAPVGKSESEEANGNLVPHEGGPVLVPGLSPLPPMPSEIATQDQDKSEKSKLAIQDQDVRENSIDLDASRGVNEIKNQIILELDEKHKTDDTTIIGNQPEEETTEMVSDEHHLKSEVNQIPVAKEEDKKQEDSVTPDNNALHSDIQWGRQTLQKLLSNLGLL